MTSTQRGFSLIELVIVVTILGLLAVTALPRFLDVTEEAQIANIEGMAGGFATGVSLVRAQWEAEGRPQDSNVNSVVYDGQLMYLTEESAGTSAPGYPVNAGSGNTANGTTMTTTRCIRVWDAILQNPATVTDNINNAVDNRYFVDLNNGDCVFYLTQTLDRNGSTYTDPNGSLTTGNNFVYSPGFGSVRVNINN
ncbi:MSHA biogenesis protein MshB [Neiella marina]|uniref:MSHA biogenesis protein MshB n=1 Tax=Neiella marina TaxID=508461 RepID=A0A8J2U6Y3_9GAMM|nr:prepilin-type N-terminal cleavage/methylation domain-containing protein [Neiella marina]GGA82898.1 MSHA biogenesis protein MshB [Neiella marina]